MAAAASGKPLVVFATAIRTGEAAAAWVDTGRATTARVTFTVVTVCCEADLFLDTTDDPASGRWRCLGAVPPNGAQSPGVYRWAFSGLDAFVRLRYATGGQLCTFAATLELV